MLCHTHTHTRNHIYPFPQYTHYNKPGKYGDEKAEKFACVADEQSEAVAASIAGLSVGDKVVLAWHHDYVTSK